MKVQKFIEVRLLKKRIIPVIDLVQYDTGVQLVFSVVDFDIPSSTSATLYVQKRSGKFVYQEKDITVSGNQITIDLENQALTEHGETKYQVKLKNGTDTITTFTGVLRIEKSLADANAVESKTVIRAFDELTADKLAEFRAEAEVIAQNVIATIPEDYTVMEAKVNELANGIKGNLSGAVVFADDVSPVEHEPAVKAHGKNLIDTSKIETQTSDNIYISAVGEGYIEITTATGYVSNGHRQTYVKLKDLCPQMVANRSYVLNAETESTLEMAHLRDVDYFVYFGKPFVVTDEMLESYLAFYGLDTRNNTTGGTCRISNIQLEEGAVATDYEPYIDPSTVTVRRCGKNLLPNAATNESYNGITIAVNEDKTLSVNGTATDTIFYAPYEFTFRAGVEYFLSGCPTGGSADTYFVYINNLGGVRDYGEGVSVLLDEDFTSAVGFCVRGGTAINSLTFKPMVRLAVIEDTRFEKYVGTAYIPSSDGTVSGLTSVSPNMTILTDTKGAIVECEYNRDTNKVIEKLTNAIIALGGAV